MSLLVESLKDRLLLAVPKKGRLMEKTLELLAGEYCEACPLYGERSGLTNRRRHQVQPCSPSRRRSCPKSPHRPVSHALICHRWLVQR